MKEDKENAIFKLMELRAELESALEQNKSPREQQFILTQLSKVNEIEFVEMEKEIELRSAEIIHKTPKRQTPNKKEHNSQKNYTIY